ncbi:MAG TPA: Ig-like domain-containing protein [Geomonas sp.]|nr:Ig-like domain-containing protein [Geomonas sp.]
MKARSIVYVMMLALGALLTACGSGGGGGGSAIGFFITPISVKVAQNPVLKGYSTTVIANFAPYTSAGKVKFGSTVNFSASAGASITPTAVTGAGGIATVKVKSDTAGTYTVSASSGLYAGSTSVSFIDQPARADVFVSLNRTINGFGGCEFDFQNSAQAVFNNFSSLLPHTGGGFTGTNPIPEGRHAFWVDFLDLNVPSTGWAKVDITSLTQLFRLNFTVNAPTPGTTTGAGLPAFAIGPNNIFASYTSGRNVAPPVIQGDFNTLKVKYYDANGKVLFQ